MDQEQIARGLQEQLRMAYAFHEAAFRRAEFLRREYVRMGVVARAIQQATPDRTLRNIQKQILVNLALCEGAQDAGPGIDFSKRGLTYSANVRRLAEMAFNRGGSRKSAKAGDGRLLTHLTRIDAIIRSASRAGGHGSADAQRLRDVARDIERELRARIPDGSRRASIISSLMRAINAFEGGDYNGAAQHARNLLQVAQKLRSA